MSEGLVLSLRSMTEWLGNAGVPFMIPEDVAYTEDVILSKLEWARLSGGSERQMRDVAGVIEAAGGDLDRGYIEHWVDELGVREGWELAGVARGSS
ncbi:MAG: hypothetical protein JRH11_18440 [Deltaproteobacteria bacterium]|nr:hypothetical protein [Deltaproteobacteria bacterium]